MSKHIFAFLLMVLLVLLAGCRSEVTAQPTPTRYWTALEAYEQIRPAMLAWHEDAVVVRINAINDERSGWRVRNDGTAAWWGFEVSSPSTDRTTVISLKGEEIVVGIDGIAGYEISMTTDQGLPLDQMIDTDQAVIIALENGVSPSDILVGIKTSLYDGRTDVDLPMSWKLSFSSPHNMSGEKWMFINATTGGVVQNDFAE